jgi:hypothetical protein
MMPRKESLDNPYAGARAKARLPQVGTPPTIDRYETQILARLKSRSHPRKASHAA